MGFADMTQPEKDTLAQALDLALTSLLTMPVPELAPVVTVLQQASQQLKSGAAVEAALSALLAVLVNDLPRAAQSSPLPGGPTAAWQAVLLDSLRMNLEMAFPATPRPAPVERSLLRLRALGSFYNSMLSSPLLQGGMPQQTPVSSARQMMVGNALAEIGKVKSWEQADKDDQGRAARTGWRDLKKYFDGGFGGSYPDQDILKHRRVGAVWTGKVDEQGNKVFTQQDQLPHWCGIFATWAARTAGLPVPPWVLGSSINTRLKAAPLPRAGDVVLKASAQHHGVITWVEPYSATALSDRERKALKIRTVEGNASPNGGEVTERGEHTLGTWDQGVYSVD